MMEMLDYLTPGIAVKKELIIRHQGQEELVFNIL